MVTLMEVRQLAPISNLALIGYFAVLESLVVSDTKRRRITEQLANKVPFALEHGARSAAVHFGSRSCDSEFWRLLYGLRSSLAHSGSLESKGAGSLPDEEWRSLPEFLFVVGQRLVNAAVDNPQFFAGLKDC